MPYNFNQNKKLSLSKFESMLKTNNVFFFDSTEFENIIQHYLDVGRQSLAHKAIKLGLDQYPTSVDLKLLKAELFIYEDKLDDADKILNELHAIEPNNEEIYIQKANILSKKGTHQNAIDSLKIALDFTDEKSEILAMIGIEYLYLDKFDKARMNFAKCLEVDYEDYSSLYNVVYCYDMQNMHVEAIEYLINFIDKDPFSEVAWHQLGRQYFVLKKYEEALRAFDYAVVIDDSFVGAFLEKAKTLEQLKQYKEAIENYLITVELDDPTAFAYYRIGECYSEIGNTTQALKYLKKTVKEDPLLDKGWVSLCQLYCDDERYEKALYYVNKALEIDESNILYWRMYAEINLKLDFLEDVAKAFYNCIEFGDESLDVYLGLVDVLNFIGEFEDTYEILTKAVQVYPSIAELEYRMGSICLILGNNKKGIEFLSKGLETDYEYYSVVKELFPEVFELDLVKDLIQEYIKSH